MSRSRRLISCKPSGGRELGDPIDWEVSQARQDRAKIVANRDFESSAGFDDRDDGCNARSSFLASDVYPVAASKRDRAHRVLSEVVTQFQTERHAHRIAFAESPWPNRQSVARFLGGEVSSFRLFGLAPSRPFTDEPDLPNGIFPDLD